MKIKKNLYIAAFFAASATACLAGCGGGGVECGDGTTLQGESCVPDTVCGEGTSLTDGACVVDTSGCGQGTSAVDDVCVPDDTLCEDGTTFDSGTRTCVPNLEVICGSGTQADDASGACVPAAESCAAGTALDAEGRCVVQDMACAAGTVLDANSGTCVLSDESCGAGTAFSDGACTPTEDVCAEGTTYSDSTGLCLPDVTCQVGDLILDGLCVPSRDALLEVVDLTETENNDPALGGTAETLSLEAIGEQAVFGGGIGQPADLDGDMVADQDVDVYAFSATAGQTFKLSLLPSPEAPLLTFRVTGPEDWTRWGTIAIGGGSAREIVIPGDGDYAIEVAPVSHWFGAQGASPLGSDDAEYVAYIEEIEPFVAADFDIESGPLSGELLDLSDNYFKLSSTDGATYMYVRTNELATGVATGYVSILNDQNEVVSSAGMVSGELSRVRLPDSGDVYAFFDWGRITAPKTSFEVELIPVPSQDLGAIGANASKTSTSQNIGAGTEGIYTFNVQPGEVIEVTQTNMNGAVVKLDVFDAAEQTVYSSQVFAPSGDTNPGVAYIFSPNGGDYTIVVGNPDMTVPRVSQTVRVRSITPSDLGSKAGGESLNVQDTGAIEARRRAYYRATFSEAVQVSGSLLANSMGDPHFYMFDPVSGGLLYRAANNGAESIATSLPAGEYFVVIEANTALATGFNLNTTLVTNPNAEIEPNDSDATATALPEGATFNAIIDGNDTDIYSVTLAQPLTSSEVLFVNLTPSLFGRRALFSCALIDSNGTRITERVDFQDTCGVYAGGLAAGTYFFEVTTDAASAVSYTVEAAKGAYTLESESNDDTTTANPLPALPGNFLGEISAADAATAVDVFSFEVTTAYTVVGDTGQGVRVALAPAPFAVGMQGDLLFDLLDDTGAVIRSGVTDAALPLLPQGTYYVRVSRVDSDAMLSGQYQVQLTEEAFTTQAQGGDTCALASPVFASGTFSGVFDGSNNDYSPTSSAASCTDYTALGADVVYSISMGANETLTATLTGDNDTSLYLVTDCADVTNSCLVGDDTFGVPESITYTATSPIQVFLIVDQYSSSATSGAYTVTIDLQ